MPRKKTEPSEQEATSVASQKPKVKLPFNINTVSPACYYAVCETWGEPPQTIAFPTPASLQKKVTDLLLEGAHPLPESGTVCTPTATWTFWCSEAARDRFECPTERIVPAEDYE